MSKKTIRLTESQLKEYISKVVSEQVKPPTGDFTTIGRFGTSDAKTLKERGFTVKGGVAILNHPNPKLVVTVKPSQKGWAAYQGGVLKFDLPHDDCDVQLDKLIGYNSLHGGYKTGLKEQGSMNEQQKLQIDPNRKKYFDSLAQQITSKLIGQKIWFNQIGVLEGGQSVTIKSYVDRSHVADLVNEPLKEFTVVFNVTRDKEDLYKSEKPGTRVWQGYVFIKLDLKNPNTPIVELSPLNDLSNKMVPSKPLTWNEVGGKELWMLSTKFNTQYN